MSFSDKLKSLRIEQGISTVKLAKIFNFSQRTIQRWEAGQRIPDLEIIILIAKYFNVSADYLLGIEDSKD